MSENANGFLDKLSQWASSNRKMLTIVGGGLVVIFGGYLGYSKFYMEPRNKKAMEQLWKADFYFERDSFNLAINGDATGMPGYKSIAKKYSGTNGANIANYGLGISYLNTGEYKKAIEALENCNFDDDLLGPISLGAMGDAYSELKMYDEAADKYMEAAGKSTNDFTTPIYLKKAAFVYEKKGNFKKAAELYERIWKEFEHTQEGRDIEKYLARAKNLSGGK